jgi:hypothetical protein
MCLYYLLSQRHKFQFDEIFHNRYLRADRGGRGLSSAWVVGKNGHDVVLKNKDDARLARSEEKETITHHLQNHLTFYRP